MNALLNIRNLSKRDLRTMTTSKLLGSLFLLLLICGLSSDKCDARTWTDIEPLHSRNPKDQLGLVYLRQADQFYENTIQPTQAPITEAPTASPTSSMAPAPAPSEAPTIAPTPAPTPDPDPYPQIDLPNYPETWYFNYDSTKGAKYGPGYPGLVSHGNSIAVGYRNNGWSTVGNPPGRLNNWLEFSDNGYGPWKGVLGNRDPMRNMCSRVGLQSPIDLYESGAKCEEHHEVRSRPGDFRIGGNSVLKLIQSNKLRLKYQRRNCADLDNPLCQEPDPPHGDFPNGWGGFADTMHVDFKVTSEHLIEGKRYDAEMQIFHLHTGRRRMPAQAALIQATDDGFNYYFEEMLKVFEYQYRYDGAKCAAKKRRERELRAIEKTNVTQDHGVDFEFWEQFEIEDQELDELEKDIERGLQMGVWDPHHEMLVPSIHFWRYDGSLTEPPCGEWVSWFVCDKPMTISFDQLERMKKILFTHVDWDCKKTSVHNSEHSVARPVQDSAGRPVWKCTSSDFLADK